MFTVPDDPNPFAVNKIIGTLKLDKQPKPDAKRIVRRLSNCVKSKPYRSPLVLPVAHAGSDANRREAFALRANKSNWDDFNSTLFVVTSLELT
jgi:hypothetical protein